MGFIQKLSATSFIKNETASATKDSQKTKNDESIMPKKESVSKNTTGCSDEELAEALESARNENSYDCPDCENELTPYKGEWQNGVKTHNHWSQIAEFNQNINKSKFFFSPYVHHTDLIDQVQRTKTLIGANGASTATVTYNHFQMITTSAEITEEEAAHGVVKKERREASHPFSHSDVFTYADGSILENSYSTGIGQLLYQKEITYSEGCDPNNLKDGDIKIVLGRKYNDDGSYTEIRTTSTWNEEANGWVTTLERRLYDAYDSDGNKLDPNSKEAKEMTPYFKSW